LPAWGLDRRDQPQSWLIFRFEASKGKLDFYVEVRRMTELEKRRRIINELIAKGSRFGFKRQAGAIKDNYTRISGRERILEWTGDEEPEDQVVRAAIINKLDATFVAVRELPAILAPLIT
jgi:hypothetical protein